MDITHLARNMTGHALSATLVATCLVPGLPIAVSLISGSIAGFTHHFLARIMPTIQNGNIESKVNGLLIRNVSTAISTIACAAICKGIANAYGVPISWNNAIVLVGFGGYAVSYLLTRIQLSCAPSTLKYETV